MDRPFTTTSPIVASYDWKDLRGETGFIRFYGAAATKKTGTTYFLTRNVVDAQPILTEDYNAGAGRSIDFDIKLESPSIISGEATFNITRQVASAGASVTQTLDITVYHVSAGAVETSLGTVEAVDRVDTVAGIYRECLTINLTEKNFAAGDTLRITVDISKTLANAGYIFHDPASSLTKTEVDTRTVGTDFTCDIPFKIDL